MSLTTNTSSDALKQIDAGLLNVGYAEAGPSDGPAAFLLHGWPTTSAAMSTSRRCSQPGGYRVIVPYVRGYGTTHFVSSETLPNGQQSVVALDTIALMDVLQIERAIVAGFDWGARTADTIAAGRNASKRWCPPGSGPRTTGPLDHWMRARDAVYGQIMERGWSPRRKAFVQYRGASVLGRFTDQGAVWRV